MILFVWIAMLQQDAKLRNTRVSSTATASDHIRRIQKTGASNVFLKLTETPGANDK